MDHFLSLFVGIILVVGGAISSAATVAPAVNDEKNLGGQLEQPFLVYARNYTSPCFADYVPTSEEVAGRFSLTLAGNEWEPLQVGLYVPSGKPPLTEVRVAVESEVPFQVGYLFYDAAGPQWRPIDEGKGYAQYPGGRRAMPLYLVPGDTITRIDPGHSAAFWITFRARANAPPGRHARALTLSASGVPPQRVPFEVHIHPFTLPRPQIAFGMYYRADRIPGYWTREYQQRYAKDMAAHGMNSGQIVSFFPSFGKKDYREQGRVEIPPTAGGLVEPWLDLLEESEYADGRVDPARLVEEQIKTFQRAGLVHPDGPIFTVQENVADCPRIDFVAQTFRDLTLQHGWPEILLQTRDEPPPWYHGPEAVGRATIEGMLAFKRLENCRTFTALSGPGVLAWGHLHDVWIVLGGHITPEMVREARRQGARVWTYLHDLRITNPLVNRYYAGFYTWALGLHGNAPYAYAHYVQPPEWGQASTDPVWLPDQARPSQGQVLGFILPGPDGPLPGVGWEGRREGVDDYRYLQLLQARLAAAESTRNEVAREAEEWLTGLRQRWQRQALRGVLYDHFEGLWGLDWYDPDPDLSPEEYRAIREQAGRYIAQLPPAPEEENPVPSDDPRQFPPSGWEGAPFDHASLAECRQALEEGTSSQKRAAASALMYRDREAMSDADVEACVAALIPLLSDAEARIPALRALRVFGPQAQPAIPAIQAQLQAEDPFIRCGALLALASIGPAAREALTRGLEDPFPMNAKLASRCLERIDAAGDGGP